MLTSERLATIATSQRDDHGKIPEIGDQGHVKTGNQDHIKTDNQDHVKTGKHMVPLKD